MADGQEDRHIKAQNYEIEQGWLRDCPTVQSVAWGWGCWWGLDCSAGAKQGESWEWKGLMRRLQSKDGKQ